MGELPSSSYPYGSLSRSWYQSAGQASGTILSLQAGTQLVCKGYADELQHLLITASRTAQHSASNLNLSNCFLVIYEIYLKSMSRWLTEKIVTWQEHRQKTLHSQKRFQTQSCQDSKISTRVLENSDKDADILSFANLNMLWSLNGLILPRTVKVILTPEKVKNKAVIAAIVWGAGEVDTLHMISTPAECIDGCNFVAHDQFSPLHINWHHTRQRMEPICHLWLEANFSWVHKPLGTMR